MPSAEIIAIGTELLLGEIQDTNTRYLARALREAGVDLYRTMIVGDNAVRIAQAIQEALERNDMVITTGGLGPTVDDPTRQAVALAVGVETEFVPALWDQIQSHFQRYGRKSTENNKRQAFIPSGAFAVENPVGTAPAFIYETGAKSIVSLPGVPHEMEYLVQNAILPYLKTRFNLKGTILARVLHTASMGESQIDEIIGDLEVMLNPTVGLLAHPGQTDIRITAKGESIEKSIELIEPLVAEIYRRLGGNIYGEDGATLESVIKQLLSDPPTQMVVIEAGIATHLTDRLGILGDFLVASDTLKEPLEATLLERRLTALKHMQHADLALGISLTPSKDKQEVLIILMQGDSIAIETRNYGGPPQHGPLWAANLGLDWLRRKLVKA